MTYWIDCWECGWEETIEAEEMPDNHCSKCASENLVILRGPKNKEIDWG